MADAKSQGCDTLVSVGGVQSNHTRAVTATATASGMKGESRVPCSRTGFVMTLCSRDGPREGQLIGRVSM